MRAAVRILVFGAGAMGSFFGGLLSARHDVTLVGRPDHIAAIRAHGLRISGKTSRIAKPDASVKVPRGARPDIVILATKAYDTAAAMTELKVFGPKALFVTLQNGLDNGTEIARSARRVVVGTTAHGVTLVGPGEVRHAGVGDTVIGAWANVEPRELVRLRDLFEDAGIPTQIASDVRTELWLKAIVNAAINPLAALAGVANGRLVRDRALLAALEGVVREAAAAARAAGADVDPEEILRRTILVARRTAGNRCSMLQDLDRGRKTEIDAITGAIVAIARLNAIPVPRNETLHALVRAREAGRRAGA
jgi:2-dehydropantoate 2-reductase